LNSSEWEDSDGVGPNLEASLMLELPKITIVTPSYNQGQYLEQTILSVLGQQYPNLEYIIMDGGSSDDSLEIIKRYADKLAYWQSKPDHGQVDAIAQGFEMSKGDILGWLNSDDILLPGCLRIVGSRFSDTPSMVTLSGRVVYIDSEGKPFRAGVPIRRKTWRHMLFHHHTMGQMATFWTRSAYETVGGLDTTLTFSFDFDLFVRLKQIGEIYLINDYLAGFRWHPSQKTHRLVKTNQMEDQLLRERYDCCSFPWVSVLSRKARLRQRIAEYLAWQKDRTTLIKLCESWRAMCTGAKEGRPQ